MRAGNDTSDQKRHNRLIIADRLFREGLYDEAAKLRHCGEEIGLTCTACGTQKNTEKTCKRRWCPDCAETRGYVLAEKYGKIVEKLKWPLMLTLTLPHGRGNDPVEMLTQLRAGMKKLRRLKWWKGCVRGGIGAIEISAGNHGWHIHSHLLLDSQWLSVTTAKPTVFMSRTARKSCYSSSQREVAAQWALCVGEDTAHIWIKRASQDAVREALKYAVKPGTLEKIKMPLRPLIEGFKSRRLVSAWGTIRTAARAVKIEEDAEPSSFACQCGCVDWALTRAIDNMLDSQDKSVAQRAHAGAVQIRKNARAAAT